MSLCNHNAANGPMYDTSGDGYVAVGAADPRTSHRRHHRTGHVLGWMDATPTAQRQPFADSRNGMLTVGTDGNLDIGYPRSGWGPTNDGRLKPELVAKGCIATSVDGGLGDDSCSNEGFAGSDAATAVAVGIAALTSPVTGAVTPLQITRYVRDQGLNAGRAHPERTSLDTWFASIPSPPPTSTRRDTADHQPWRWTLRCADRAGRHQPRPAGQPTRPFTSRCRMHGCVLNVGMVKASAKAICSSIPPVGRPASPPCERGVSGRSRQGHPHRRRRVDISPVETIYRRCAGFSSR